MVLQIASQLFDYCWKHWQSDVQSILQNFSALSQCSTANSLSGQMDDFFLVCERWFMCTKIIRHLVISGHRSDVLDGVEVSMVIYIYMSSLVLNLNIMICSQIYFLS